MKNVPQEFQREKSNGLSVKVCPVQFGGGGENWCGGGGGNLGRGGYLRS